MASRLEFRIDFGCSCIGSEELSKVLSVAGLCKAFKGRPVVRNISFDVHAGEITAILGPNGAGKSTTIRNIMGIIMPDEGSIHFHNHSGKGIPRQKIGYLPEERGLYRNVQVMDVLLYLAELKDYPLSKAKERALRYLAKFGLEGKERLRVEELSKGMAQKVQFIAAVIHEPELIILDEPFSGLDPVSQEVFKREIRELAGQGAAILLSSHQMNLVEELCDRLLMIHRGEKVIEGSLNEVKQRYANFKCMLRCEHPEWLRGLPGVRRMEFDGDRALLYLSENVQPVTWLKQLPDQLQVYELTIDRISLHEIFVQIATGDERSRRVEVDAG